jgi:hypothetical protein
MKIERLAELLYRSSTDEPLTAESRRGDLQAHYALFAVIYGTALLAYAAFMALELNTPRLANREILPHIFFAANALFAPLMFCLWLTQRQHLEYFYIAIYGAISALVQLRMLDVFRVEVSITDAILFDSFLLAGEGGFGLLMALTFARSRFSFIRWGLPTLVGLPILVQLLFRFFDIPVLLNASLALFYVPVLYTFGAFACVIQASYLLQSGLATKARGRLMRLACFSMLMIGFAIAAILPKSNGGILQLRLPQLLLLLAISALAIFEFRKKDAT